MTGGRSNLNGRPVRGPSGTPFGEFFSTAKISVETAKMTKKPRPGRPSFKIARAHRALVEQLIAVGADQKMIAAAIGCSVVTLRANFER